MKKLTLSLLFCLALFGGATAQVYVQTFNEYGGAEGKAININELDIEFCRITLGPQKKMRFDIYVDYGQDNQGVWSNKSKASDMEGKLLRFNSLIDAMNHMYRNGWDYVQEPHGQIGWLLFRKR